MEMTEDIYNTTLNILKKSKDERIPTSVAAMRIAEQRIEEVGRMRLTL
jgi:leucine dehydrogenase